MQTYTIKLIQDNKVIDTIQATATCQSKAEDIAFQWADLTMGDLAKDIELFFIDNPRHQILFKGVSK